ncbi:hypothetical protein L1987_14223 [Smallanthus sonchifolius]|uniref:Uncharacterized protein n=1 Tax=Smallanthus sonchifolius TaxID=185202 RepID=A0ACB9J297_9ASTR|nr:hypothetical protein L1987_14223 [Smallanthus sonchifolius]
MDALGSLLLQMEELIPVIKCESMYARVHSTDDDCYDVFEPLNPTVLENLNSDNSDVLKTVVDLARESISGAETSHPVEAEKSYWLSKEDSPEQKLKELQEQPDMHIEREAALERNISHSQIEKHSWLHKEVCFEDTRIQIEAKKVNLAQKDRVVADTMASLNKDNAKLQAQVIELETSINILQGIPSFSIPKELRHVKSLISTTFLIATSALETSNSSSTVVPTIVDVDLGDRGYPIYIGSVFCFQPDLLQIHIHGKRVLVVTTTTMTLLYLDKVVSALTDGNPTVIVEKVILPGDMCGYATSTSPTGKTDINHHTDTSNTLPDGELASVLVEVFKYGLIKDAFFFESQEKNLQALTSREPDAFAYAINRLYNIG